MKLKNLSNSPFFFISGNRKIEARENQEIASGSHIKINILVKSLKRVLHLRNCSAMKEKISYLAGLDR